MLSFLLKVAHALHQRVLVLHLIWAALAVGQLLLVHVHAGHN